MDLLDTIHLMTSDDYRDRLKAEYYQLKIRYDKLCIFIYSYEKDMLKIQPKVSLNTLRGQKNMMYEYLKYLQFHLEEENIDF